MEYKPGYKTTEFWLVLASFFACGIFLLGGINYEQQQSLSTALEAGVKGTSLVLAQVFMFAKYLASRNQHKNECLAAPATIQQTPVVPVQQVTATPEIVTKSVDVPSVIQQKPTTKRKKKRAKRGPKRTIK